MLNRADAIAEDLKFARECEGAFPYYSEYDEEEDLWFVFGINSGFAYSSFCDGAEAEGDANRRNANDGFV